MKFDVLFSDGELSSCSSYAGSRHKSEWPVLRWGTGGSGSPEETLDLAQHRKWAALSPDWVVLGLFSHSGLAAGWSLNCSEPKLPHLLKSTWRTVLRAKWNDFCKVTSHHLTIRQALGQTLFLELWTHSLHRLKYQGSASPSWLHDAITWGTLKNTDA